MSGLADGKSPEETVRLAALAAMADPDGFLTSLGRRLSWERMRGRAEGLGIAIWIVWLGWWLTDLEPLPLSGFLALAALVAYLLAAFIGKRPR